MSPNTAAAVAHPHLAFDLRAIGHALMTMLLSYGFARGGRYDGDFAIWANHRLFPKG
jgi:hypothetical protein